MIAYTGAMLNERAAKLASQRADAIIKKAIDIEDWIAKLDEFGAVAIDPHAIWNKVRIRLVELDVDSRDILLLEDAYVRSVLGGDPHLSTLSKRTSSLGIGPDVRAIMQGLASSAIFSAIVGQN